MFAALLIDNLLEPPVLVSGFAFGVAIVAYVRSTGGGRVHYWAAAALLVATSVASAFGLAPTGREATALVFILLGAIYVVGGVLDHFELRHRLKAAPQG
jgi:hypothetical protein